MRMLKVRISMKRLSLIPLIVILTACVSSPAPVTPTQKIETATPTPTVTITDTAEPTSTVTPDPLADAPKGYTNFDKETGVWTRIDAESGKTIFWDVERNAEYSLLFEDDLWDHRPDLESNYEDSMRLKVFISPKLTNWNKLTVTHKENLDPTGTINWTLVFHAFLKDTMVWGGMINSDADFSWDQYYGAGYTRHFNTIEGPQSVTLKHGNIQTVHIIDGFEAIKADSENNHFMLVNGSSTIGAPAISFMVRIRTDAKGNTFTEIAPNNSDVSTWSEKRIMEMMLVGLTNVLQNPSDPLKIVSAGFSSDLVMNHSAYPYFIFAWRK